MLKKHFKNQNVTQELSTHVRYSPSKHTPDREARDTMLKVWVDSATLLTAEDPSKHRSSTYLRRFQNHHYKAALLQAGGNTRSAPLWVPPSRAETHRNLAWTSPDVNMKDSWSSLSLPPPAPETHAMNHTIYSPCFRRVMGRNNSKTLTCYLSDLCFRVDAETTRSLSH